jgi:hypothetical protein
LDAREQMVAQTLAERLGIAPAHVDELMHDTPRTDYSAGE